MLKLDFRYSLNRTLIFSKCKSQFLSSNIYIYISIEYIIFFKFVLYSTHPNNITFDIYVKILIIIYCKRR